MAWQMLEPLQARGHGRTTYVVPVQDPKAAVALVQDEPFHVKQTQAYCAGHYDAWDPKITTFPGLYVVGAAAARLLQRLQHIAPMFKVCGRKQVVCVCLVVLCFAQRCKARWCTSGVFLFLQVCHERVAWPALGQSTWLR